MEKEQMTMTEMLEELEGIVCTQLCKYNDVIDDECKCRYIRENGECPLNKYI